MRDKIQFQNDWVIKFMKPTSSNMLSSYRPNALCMPIYKFAFNIFANAKNTGAAHLAMDCEWEIV